MRAARNRYNAANMTTHNPIVRRAALISTLAAVGIANAAHGCAVCMGTADSTEQQGVNAALLTMLGLMSIVFSAIAAVVARIVWCAHTAPGTPESATQ